MAGTLPTLDQAAEEIKELAGLCPQLNGAARTNIVRVIGNKMKLMPMIRAKHGDVLKSLLGLRHVLQENGLDTLDVEDVVLGVTAVMVADVGLTDLALPELPGINFPLRLISCGALWAGRKTPFGLLSLIYDLQSDAYTIYGTDNRLLGEPGALISFDPTSITAASFENGNPKILLNMYTPQGTCFIYMWMANAEVADSFIEHLLELERIGSRLTHSTFDTIHLSDTDLDSRFPIPNNNYTD